MSTFAADNLNLIPEESGKKSFLDKALELVSDKSGSVKDKIFGVFGSWSLPANRLPGDYGTYPAGGGTPSSNQDPDNEPPRKLEKKSKTEAFRDYNGNRSQVVEVFILNNLDLDSDELVRLIVAEYTYYNAPSKKRILIEKITELKSTPVENFDEIDTLVETHSPDEFDLIDAIENLGRNTSLTSEERKMFYNYLDVYFGLRLATNKDDPFRNHPMLNNVPDSFYVMKK